MVHGRDAESAEVTQRLSWCSKQKDQGTYFVLWSFLVLCKPQYLLGVLDGFVLFPCRLLHHGEFSRGVVAAHRTLLGEVDNVFDAHAEPAGEVDARLD